MQTKERTLTEVLLLVGSINFRAFTDADWETWVGCGGTDPMIGDTREIGADYQTIVILDCEQIVVMDVSDTDEIQDEGRFYRLVEGPGF